MKESKALRLLTEIETTMFGTMTSRGGGAGFSRLVFNSGVNQFELTANKTWQQIINGEDAAVQVHIRTGSL
jgi:hypothetical protein